MLVLVGYVRWGRCKHLLQKNGFEVR